MNTMELIQIIEKVKNIIVIPPDIKKILTEVDEAVLKTQIFGTPLGCFILAEGGMGKTTICKALMSKYKTSEKRIEGAIQQIIPAFYIEVPSPVTVKSLAAHMLEQFNDPTPSIGDTLQLTNRLCKCIETCETKLIILDEFHHLVDLTKTSKRLNQNVASWIKNLVNRTGITFCLVGLPEFENIIKNDTQLARRFPLSYHFKKLEYSLDQNGSLQKFLDRYQKNITEHTPITFETPLKDELLSLQIYVATGGNIAFISLLIKQTIFKALQNNYYNIKSIDFAETWETGLTSFVSLINQNPFLMNKNQLSLKIRFR
ncbi:TniB family NTP-binding protein [Acinetobacter sp. YH12134]|uniref:TniB family NTP-binding protein n=1 Tax=Acinetobacter sp. YH12134 TaxID=2601118 RepID=UPI0015D27130|nr:TniB family NTP-binding protein [Acinetobacter sp. YH12134]